MKWVIGATIIIHIRDISKGELMIMHHGKIGHIYHLSPDRGIAVREVVEAICNRMNVSFSDAVVEVEERLGQDKAYTIDSSKARNEIGWQPSISLKEGIEDCVSWVLNNFDQIEKEPLQYEHKE
jgi:dTDP-glucose 4,6-dehydratase